MTIMPANNTHWLVHYWQGRYGNLGHLYSPSRVEKPFPHIRYVLDNGAFGCWSKGKEWDSTSFLKHVERYAFHQNRPDWVVVPDVVAERHQTLANWDRWAPLLKHEYMLPLALAVQDGMTLSDVLCLDIRPDVIFVGGSTEWKWDTFNRWANDWDRVHVGRVNTEKYLLKCLNSGVESCDGTGFFRGRPEQLIEVGRTLAKMSGQYGPAEEREICRVVYHSRVSSHEQLVLPIGESA